MPEYVRPAEPAPAFALPQPPRPTMGCICPAGANLTCGNPICPRKPISQKAT